MPLHKVAIKHVMSGSHNEKPAPDNSLADADGSYIVTKIGDYIICNPPLANPAADFTADIINFSLPLYIYMTKNTFPDTPVTVDWGDGSAIDSLSGFVLSFSHYYSKNGSYNITIGGGKDKVLSLNLFGVNLNRNTVNKFSYITDFDVNDYTQPIRSIVFKNQKINSFESVIDGVYDRALSGWGYSQLKTLTLDGGGNAIPSGTYQAPSGYIQANATTVGSDGNPISAKEKIYVLVNQNIDNTNTKKYNWSITYN